MSSDLKPCPFCGAPGFAMLAPYGFRIKCTDTDCTVETPIKTHRHEVDALWNRRVAAVHPEARADSAVPSSHVSETDGKHYAARDHMAQGEYYLRHVSAMTAEGLHRKSDIAAELAWRDMEIDRLKAEGESILREALARTTWLLEDWTNDFADCLEGGGGERVSHVFAQSRGSRPISPSRSQAMRFLCSLFHRLRRWWTRPPAPPFETDSQFDARQY